MPLDPDVAVLVAAIADGAAPELTDGDIASSRQLRRAVDVGQLIGTRCIDVVGNG